MSRPKPSSSGAAQQTSITFTSTESMLLLQCLNRAVQTGQLDDAIRAGGVAGCAELAQLADKLTKLSENSESKTDGS